VPVVALGGITSPDRAAACMAAGAVAVAVMGAIMRAADPASTVASFLAAADSWSAVDAGRQGEDVRR
jgi:thiamine monophosphate synthase